MEKLRGKYVESLTIVVVIQALDDNSFQADNQQKATDIEYNSCYWQSKTLSSYNHKAAQVLSAIKNATRNGTEYDSSSASAIL
ncbi:hypothetical protein WR25_00377 [Diploscapter pachys]|uniref:Uncharacterized protein n=1 Tax=Diploscapter pachys TaxID=2018661 RepID=A0A2A2JZ33_9BILA|nr:hypothetical protein WR25_00377 [Diploscapter pachys]